MSLQITFKNFDHTPSLDQKIKEKTDKLRKLFSHEVNVHWVCWTEHDRHMAEINITGQRGPKIQAKAHSDSLYKTLDMIIKKVEGQVKKRLERKQERQVEHIWT